MLTMFRALPLLWRLIAVIGLLASLAGAVGGAYAYVRHQGYVDGYSDASAKCEADKQKMEEANRKAIDEAARKLAEAEKLLTEKETKIDDLLMAIDSAADLEPGSGDICLSADGVRRLSQF